MDFAHQIFHDGRLKQIVDDALSFINRTDFYPLPLPSGFSGSGVYLLYYGGDHQVYRQIRELKVNNQRVPIYVGKAVPPGWRQGRNFGQTSKVLYSRLREHARSIEMINQFRPIWNSCIDGFGNHDPGKGRAQQARSEWDTIHPGRYWAEKLAKNRLSVDDILQKGGRHFCAKG